MAESMLQDPEPSTPSCDGMALLPEIPGWRARIVFPSPADSHGTGFLVLPFPYIISLQETNSKISMGSNLDLTTLSVVCGRSISSTLELVRAAAPPATPDLLSRNLHSPRSPGDSRVL